MSVYDCWVNDDTLLELVREHMIYHCYLNKNKILQGVPYSSLVYWEPFDSPAMLKWKFAHSDNEKEIINDEIYSSTSMLATISSGKRYMYHRYENDIVRQESENLQNFIKKYFKNDYELITK